MHGACVFSERVVTYFSHQTEKMDEPFCGREDTTHKNPIPFAWRVDPWGLEFQAGELDELTEKHALL